MIEVEKIKFRYAKKADWVIDELTFQVGQGEVLGVLGPSGGGKSTLLRLMAGLEKPEAGRISLDNRVVVSEKCFVPPEKRGIGMLFQDYALFPHLTIAKNIGFGLGKMKKAGREARIQEMLEMVNLSDYGGRYPHELSGGQQQRIALARAIAPNPKVLLLDEPFSHLDADLAEQIRKELFRIVRHLRITTIMVTHSRLEADAYADRILMVGA